MKNDPVNAVASSKTSAPERSAVIVYPGPINTREQITRFIAAMPSNVPHAPRGMFPKWIIGIAIKPTTNMMPSELAR